MTDKLKSIYRLNQEDNIPEIQTKSYQYTHIKTGAEILFLENDDENKTFGIGFKTPPTDDTGIPHILEHCVLAGSRKYKTKEPFMNLVQSSMATYLNALTYPDKTIYPIASRNMQDFKNLTDVYLDAVFYPAVYDEEKIFRQEGWRYDLPNKDAEMTYKGVVYSEMRGAYSSPDRVVYSTLTAELFPDTPYALESGGEPYTIADLEVEDYLDFHKTLYHPNNAKIYVYGDLDINEFLEYLDAEYLSNFDMFEVDPEIPFQEAFAEAKELESVYSLAPDEDTEGKTYAAWGVGLNTYEDIKANFILEVLTEALFDSQSAPVKLAIEAAELGQDFYAMTDLNQQGALAAILVNTTPEKGKQLTEIIEKTLTELVAQGIDRKLLEAALNDLEFNLREMNNSGNSGIRYFSKVLLTWLYGGDPVDSLKYADIIAELRSEIDSNIWEDFVQDKFISNTHKVSLVVEPQLGLNAEKDAKVAEKLAAYKASLTETEIDELVEQNQALYHWQETEDSPEAKATIPTLKLADLDVKVPNPPCVVEMHEDHTILKHDIFTSGINYVNFSFDLSHIKQEDLFYVSILASLLAKVDTAKYKYSELATLSSLISGGINFSPALYSKVDSDEVELKFEVRTKIIDEKDTRVYELIEEIIHNTIFSDHKRIKEVLDAELVNTLQAITNRGDNYATIRLASSFNLLSTMHEQIVGIDYYLNLKDLLSKFEERSAEFTEKLNNVYSQVFKNSGLIVSLTTDGEKMDTLLESTTALTKALSLSRHEAREWKIIEQEGNEAFKLSSNVNYVVKGFDYKELGYEYKGDMVVMANMLRSNQMHVLIRAKGGAYGNAIRISREGTFIASTYRDPNIDYTLDVYDDLGNWLLEGDFSQSDLDEYIIGSVNNFDPVLSPSAQGNFAYSRFVKGSKYEDEVQLLEDALTANVQAVSEYGKLMNEVMERGKYIVVGNPESIDNASATFDKIINL